MHSQSHSLQLRFLPIRVPAYRTTPHGSQEISHFGDTSLIRRRTETLIQAACPTVYQSDSCLSDFLVIDKDVGPGRSVRAAEQSSAGSRECGSKAEAAMTNH
jgi:hypothetical protein